MNEKDLKNGIDFNFDNEQWCEENNSDDLRCGWVTWNDRFNNFSIHFNGECVHTSKTFKATETRLKKLMEKWNCQFVSEVF